jgi:hypothetical protein
MRNTKLRVTNGVVEALFGGYVSTKRQNKWREIRVWAPASICDDDCGAGTNEIVKRIAKKASCDKCDVMESWRY